MNVNCTFNLSCVYEPLYIVNKLGGNLTNILQQLHLCILWPLFLAVYKVEKSHGWTWNCSVWVIRKAFSQDKDSAGNRCAYIWHAYNSAHYITICISVHKKNPLICWESNTPVTQKIIFTLKDKASSCLITCLLLAPQICVREIETLFYYIKFLYKP